MTQPELNTAIRILCSRCDRLSSIHLDTGGYALTAHWRDGGQRLFYSLDDVQSVSRDYADRCGPVR